MHSHVMPDCVTPRTAARQAPCPWEAQASMLESLPYPPPGDLPDPGAKLASPAAPGLGLPLRLWGSPHVPSVHLHALVGFVTHPWGEAAGVPEFEFTLSFSLSPA